jgi:Serine-pyruvate aminotransferase/archaeal aspartate aminotransferase
MAESYFPPRRVLMGPGPSDVPPRVLAAMAQPTVGHLDPSFVGLMDAIQELLRATFRTTNRLTLPVSGPGSAGMEACLVNLVEPGDTVVVCVNGVFGGRMKAIVERCGATAVTVEDAWGDPVDPAKVERALEEHPEASLVAFVHAETSTGARSDAAAVVELAHRHGCLAVVDTVTSLGGIPVEVDGWGIDATYSGSQKCLSCVPGLSPVTFGPRAVQRIERRKMPVQSWFLDMSLVMGYWGSQQRRTYHHTAPVNALYALHEALVMLHEEGLEKAWARHRRNHLALCAGLEAMGLELPVAPEHRLPELNVVAVPAGVDEAAVRRRLLEDFSLEIGAGLGEGAGRMWRIGLMGASCTPRHVLLCLTALETVLADMGAVIRRGAAAAAARAVLEG